MRYLCAPALPHMTLSRFKFLERHLVGHVKRSYGPSESSANNHPHRTILSNLGLGFSSHLIWHFFGVGHPLLRTPCRVQYLDNLEAGTRSVSMISVGQHFADECWVGVINGRR